MSKPAIRIRSLSKSYHMYSKKAHRMKEILFPGYVNHRLKQAVDDVSFEVQPGEVYGILGKNGAGKSTLLKMITGVVAPTSGEIEINGRISSLLELGTAFNPELTGLQNIWQHGQVNGMANQQIAASLPEIVAFADIGEYIDQPVKTYSSGMFARLAFACAISIHPEILIIDEVLAVGDIAFQQKCFNKINEFKSRGITVLFVSHSLSDVLRNCSRGLILDQGCKIYEGDIRRVVDEYKKLLASKYAYHPDTVTAPAIAPGNQSDAASDSQPGTPFAAVASAGPQAVTAGNNMPDQLCFPTAGSAAPGQRWLDDFQINPNRLQYGNGRARIIDMGIFNAQGQPAQLLHTNEPASIKMKVQFFSAIDEPIFAISIKDIKGLELCGANTYVYRYPTGPFYAGDIAEVTFSQTLTLGIGNYSLSFGCTKFDADGDLEIFDRQYDVYLLEFTARRDSLGLFDLNARIEMVKTSPMTQEMAER